MNDSSSSALSSSATPYQRSQVIPVASLKPADSPRTSGENPEHVRALAELEGDLPPILVHRQSMRVIDGMHRLRAALLRGDAEVEVCFFDGSDDDAFRLAVESNIAHGLPLTLAERKTAARRIVSSHACWGDHAIAAATGLSVKTVSAIRRSESPAHQLLNGRRIGVDGRVRPLSATNGRLRAGQLIQERPDASLREIARLAGISLGTAKDVRDRVRRGDSPVPTKAAGGQARAVDHDRVKPPPAADVAQQGGTGPNREAMLATLRNDPTLRFTETGRALLRWLVMRSVSEDDWDELLDAVPSHTILLVADLARLHAVSWARFAEALEDRATDATEVSVPDQRSTPPGLHRPS